MSSQSPYSNPNSYLINTYFNRTMETNDKASAKSQVASTIFKADRAKAQSL